MRAIQNLLALPLMTALSLSFSACGGDDKDDGPENDYCKNATPLALGSTVSSTTKGGHYEVYGKGSDGYDDYSYEDVFYPDVYYQVKIEQKGWYEFILESEDRTETRIGIWKSCAPADEHDPHHDDVIDWAEGEFGSDSARLALELEPGSYIVFVNPHAPDHDTKVNGYDFTLSFKAHQLTEPKLDSVQADLRFIPGEGEKHPQTVIAFRVSGEDAGKDLEGIYFTPYDENHEEAADVRVFADKLVRFFPKYDANGKFEDAYAVFAVDSDLTSAVSAAVTLADVDGLETEPIEVDISRVSELTQRELGETCDRDGFATFCAEGSYCGLDDDRALFCMPKAN